LETAVQDKDKDKPTKRKRRRLKKQVEKVKCLECGGMARVDDIFCGRCGAEL
jgi:hypothetical protein